MGPESPDGEVVLRFGDRLEVTPPDLPGAWRVTEYPSGILRLDDPAAAASSHLFDAVAIGQGRIAMVPAGSAGSAAGTYTVRIRVMRDNVQLSRP
ncbi:hypothetical protein [Actinoplanes ianthinogenes]|uniref:hypothetical protein n=1 Tax=Actinoplanes ianthinogenes TaxID=122358 RepID=UPI0016708621|nr:hypothetical protein [Actinoplanes ianthinogenes]